MLAHENPSAAHAGEDQSSAQPAVSAQVWTTNQPVPDAESLTQLVIENDWLRAGDVVYITETRRHTLTDSDLNAAARAVIGGAA